MDIGYSLLDILPSFPPPITDHRLPSSAAVSAAINSQAMLEPVTDYAAVSAAINSQAVLEPVTLLRRGFRGY